MEKAKIIVTARKAYHAISGEWWQKSESGKFWELWCEGPEKPTFLTRILAKRVLHVITFEDEKEPEGTERAGSGKSIREIEQKRVNQ